MNELVHSFRPTIFSQEHHYQLHDGTLIRTDGQARRSVALRDVVSVRIYRQPGAGVSPTIRQAILRFRTGSKIVLQSTHYIRFGVTEDRAASYRDFVGALLEQIAAANPQAKIFLGHSWLLWMTWIVILIGAVIVLAAGVLLLVMRDFPIAALLYLGIVGAFLPLTWRMVRTSRPRPIDPRALPAGILD